AIIFHRFFQKCTLLVCQRMHISHNRNLILGGPIKGEGLHSVGYGQILYQKTFRRALMERGTKPAALGRKPCHWTSTLKAAMVNARRAWKYAQTRCMTFLKWHTKVSIDKTVSTRMRSSHSPR